MYKYNGMTCKFTIWPVALFILLSEINDSNLH